jgi:hypothetical protein
VEYFQKPENFEQLIHYACYPISSPASARNEGSVKRGCTDLTEEMLLIHQERVQCSNANKILSTNEHFHIAAANDKKLIHNFISKEPTTNSALSINELFPLIDIMVRESFELVAAGLREGGLQILGFEDSPDTPDTVIIVNCLLIHLDKYNPQNLERLVALLFMLTTKCTLERRVVGEGREGALLLKELQ